MQGRFSKNSAQKNIIYVVSIGILFMIIVLLERRSGRTDGLEDHILGILVDDVVHDDKSQPRGLHVVLPCFEQGRLPCHFEWFGLTPMPNLVAVLPVGEELAKEKIRQAEIPKHYIALLLKRAEAFKL